MFTIDLDPLMTNMTVFGSSVTLFAVMYRKKFEKKEKENDDHYWFGSADDEYDRI